MNRYFLSFAVALLLAACAAPPAPPPPPTPTAAPTAAATVAPTTAPVASASPSPVPTSAQQRLPAPLYVLELGQIARIEPDGVTRTLLTAETVELDGVRPIATFTLSSLGTLAYVVGDRAADRLMVADARGRSARVLYEQPGHELSDLRFAPDGESLLFRLLNNLEPPDLPGGIYRIALAGGAPQLLRADDPVDDPVTPSRSVSGYAPLAFSPDGSQLLVAVNALFYEDCTVGVMPATGGDVVRVALPAAERLYCGEAAWAADGASLLFLAGPRDGPNAGPNLWRADAATGAAAALMAPATFVRAPLALPDGAIRFFLATVQRDPAGLITGASFATAELAPGASTPAMLGAAIPELIERALWAPDGSGAVIELSTNEQRSLLRWQPVGGEAIKLPSSGDAVVGLAWGSE